MSNAEQCILRSAEQVRILADDLARETRRLVAAITPDPADVAILSPQALEGIDNDLRQIALVLSSLGMASAARTIGFDFDPEPNPEGADNLVALAAEHAERL